MNVHLLAKTACCIIFAAFFATSSYGAEGMINIASAHNVTETSARLENILHEKKMTIFAKINHSEGARKVGINLEDTELIIFGNPKVGSPLMKCQQSVAIDLPQKALIWQDADGKVWISYNDPLYLAKRHNIAGCSEIISKISRALSAITQKAAQ